MHLSFLGLLEKLQKATISFVLSVRLFFLPPFRMKQLGTGSHGMDFREILYLEFIESVEKIQL